MEVKIKTLPLYTKVMLAFGLLFLVLTFTTGMTLWQTQRTSQSLSNLVDEKMPMMHATLLLENGVTTSFSALRGLIITGDGNFKVDFNNAWNTDIIPNVELLKALSSNSSDPKLVKTINNISERLIALKNYQNSIIESLKSGKTKPIEIFQDQEQRVSIPIIEDIKLLVKIQTEGDIQTAATVKNALSTLSLLEWTFLLTGFVVGILISRKLSRSLSDPVVKLANIADSIANGEIVTKIHLTGSSEIEHLGKSFSKMQEIMTEITSAANAISKGNYTLQLKPRCEDDKLIYALTDMTNTLEKNRQFYEEQSWLQKGINQVVTAVAKNAELNTLCNEVLIEVCRYLESGAGAIYLVSEKNENLKLNASFAYTEREFLANEFKMGESIVGQVGFELKPILLKNISRKSMVITSSLTEEPPLNIYAFPLIDKQELVGVVELAFHVNITELKMNYIERISPLIASSIHVSRQKMITERLLAEQQQLSEELQAQQEELKASNEELESQTEELKTSEEELRMLDEEQRSLNQELENRNKRLEQQTADLKIAQETLMQKSEELQRSSKYKSAFLANMSHELRTPLNSLLILSSMLTENEEGNLLEDQIESLKVIHRSGCELLELINDVLDIAKVEAGKLDIQYNEINIKGFVEKLKSDFQPIAKNKAIEFKVDIDEGITKTVCSDEQRLTQIMKNLLANAFKFTETGSVTLSVHMPSSDTQLSLNEADKSKLLAWSVIDTGIGIPKEKQTQIFQTFYQIDGTMSRKHGGAGLGLSISSQLAGLLNGEIVVNSEEDKGSIFTLYIPICNPEAPAIKNTVIVQTVSKKVMLNSESKFQGQKILLVDDDMRDIFALAAVLKKAGLQTTIAPNGKIAIEMLSKEADYDGVLMDIIMPVMDGFEAIEIIRKNKKFTSLPIIALTAKAIPAEREKCLEMGVSDYLAKPVDVNNLLILLRGCICQ